jgi:hypothetical protein
MPVCSTFGPTGTLAIRKRVQSLVSSIFAGLTEGDFTADLSTARVRKIEELNAIVEEDEKAARHAGLLLTSASVGTAAHVKVRVDSTNFLQSIQYSRQMPTMARIFNEMKQAAGALDEMLIWRMLTNHRCPLSCAFGSAGSRTYYHWKFASISRRNSCIREGMHQSWQPLGAAFESLRGQ